MIVSHSVGRLPKKLLSAFLATLCLFSVGLISYAIFVMRPRAVAEREASMATELNAAADEINSLSRERMSLAVGLARKGEFLNSILHSSVKVPNASKAEEERYISTLLERDVESFPAIIGAGLFYEPFAFDSHEERRGFYARWTPSIGAARRIDFSSIRSTSPGNYRQSEWYRAVVPSNRSGSQRLEVDSAWTNPYRDSNTLVPMISAVAAMYGNDNSVIGVSRVDWSIEDLSEALERSRKSKNSIAALFSPRTRTFAAVAGLQGMNLEPIEHARWMPYLTLNAPTDRFEMVRGKNGEDSPLRIYSRALENGLVFSFVIPEVEILSNPTKIDQQQSILLAVAFLLSAICAYLFVKRYLSPLTPLSELASQYAAGNFSESPDIYGIDELSSLSNSLGRLRMYVNRLNTAVLNLLGGNLSAPTTISTPTEGIGQSLGNLERMIRSFAEDIESLQQQIQNGETAGRLDPSKYQGCWREMTKAINQIVASFDGLIAESIAVFNDAHHGRFSSRILGSRSGVLESFRKGLNGTIENHQKIARELQINLEAMKVARDETLLAIKTKNALLQHLCTEAPILTKHILRLLVPNDALPQSKEQAQSIRTMRSHCEVMLRSFDQISGFADLEEGKVELCRDAFNLHSLLADIREILRLQTSKSKQEFTLVIDPDVPESVVGDEAVLRNILLGLGRESIRCTADDGCISIRAQVIEDATDVCTVDLTITDSCGGSLEAQRRESFSWLASNESEKVALQSGGGLGLVIASRLAEMMGGSLTFNTSAGFYAQCHLRIQLQTGNQAAEAETITNPQQELLAAPEGTMRVLIVEDDILCQKLLVRLLAKHGCHATAVGDGLEALHLLERQTFDLILMDITLPILDGIETTKRIRTSDKPYARIPIIAVTGHPMRLNTSDVTENGFNAYILKPLDSRTLRDTLLTVGNSRAGNKAQPTENQIN